MKCNVVIISLALFALVLAAGSSAHAFTYSYATAVRWDAGTHVSLSNNLTSRYNQAGALGSPNASTGTNTNFLSLGLGGIAVFDFGVEFAAAAIVFETTGGRASYPTETAKVYVAGSSYAPTFAGLNAGNGLAQISTAPFTYVTTITSKTPSSLIDLAPLGGTFRYILLQDVTTGAATGAGYDGFDVDAIGVAPVPEPATFVLAGLGMAGIVLFGRRRKNGRA